MSEFPKSAAIQADQMIQELMAKRGFPIGDFESRAADLSVDHPQVVTHYRAAQLIAERNARGEADTKELRQALVSYRVLFDELLEVDEAKSDVPPVKRVSVAS